MKTCSKVTLRGFSLGRNCPSCSHPLLHRRSYSWCKQCRKKWRPKARTLFRNCKVPEQKLLALLDAWQARATPGDCVRLLKLSYPTVQRWFQRFREALPTDDALLQGEVDVDEAFFGKRKHENQVLVFGMRERSGRLKLRLIPNRDEGTLETQLLATVHTATKLHTDAWTGYLNISWYGYAHEICNHAARDFSGTARIEAEWSRCKRHIRKLYGRFHRPYLDDLLKEWEARANFPELFTDPRAYLIRCLVPS